MIPWYVWFVWVLVTVFLAWRFYDLGIITANEKLRQKTAPERDTVGRDIVLRHLNTLRSVIDDKIIANRDLAEYLNKQDDSLSNMYEELSKQLKTIRTYVDAFIWLISLEK